MTVWRYTHGGKVRHALTVSTNAVAVCGLSVWSSQWWLGTGSQTEYETVEGLPECRNCVRRGRR